MFCGQCIDVTGCWQDYWERAADRQNTNPVKQSTGKVSESLPQSWDIKFYTLARPVQCSYQHLVSVLFEVEEDASHTCLFKVESSFKLGKKFLGFSLKVSYTSTNRPSMA